MSPEKYGAKSGLLSQSITGFQEGIIEWYTIVIHTIRMNRVDYENAVIYFRNLALGSILFAVCLVFAPQDVLADTLVFDTGVTGYGDWMSFNSTYPKGAQMIVTSSSIEVSAIEVASRYGGSGSGNASVHIYSTSGSLPNSSLTSVSVDVTTLGGTCTKNKFTLASPYTLSAGTYHIVVEQGSSSNDSFMWCAVGANQYADGAVARYNGSSWSNPWTADNWVALYENEADPIDPNLLTGTSTQAIATTTEDIMYISTTAQMYFFGILLMFVALGSTIYIWSTLRT